MGRVTQLTIQNCWKHTGILPDSEELVAVPCNNTIDEEWQELSSQIEKLPEDSPISAEEFIDIDLHLETSRPMEVDEIVDFVVSPVHSMPNTEVNEESEDEGNVVEPITSKDTLITIKTVQSFLDQSDLTFLGEDQVIRSCSVKQKEITDFF